MGNRVFIVDGTEDRLYYNIVNKFVRVQDLDVEHSMDRGVAKLGQKPYDLIVVSRTPGKLDLYDVADAIKSSKVNKKADIILLEDNPTQAAKFVGALRGRRVYRLRSNELEKFEDLTGRMLR